MAQALPVNSSENFIEAKQNLFSFDLAGMQAYFTSIGEKPFRARQVLQWIYQRQVLEFDAMTDLSKALRSKLAAHCELTLPKIVSQQLSADGTCKLLLELADGNCIETVFIPEAERGTLCVSSQVGCGLNCTFCATARQGYNRDLDTSEIISQVWVANQALKELLPEQYDPEISGHKAVTNVVMMGMGEPLLNFDNVVAAMNLMMDDYAYGLSRRRVTLSTAGLVPMMDKLNEQCAVSLAVSLHAPTDPLRDKLVPLNKKYPIEQLLDACRRYASGRNRQRITFEYVMLKGVNDSIEHAAQLAKLLKDIPSKVNLIPFNPFDGVQFERSSQKQINAFRDYLLAKDIFTVTRKTRGDDIDAACGQLAGKIEDRTNRSKRMANLKIEFNQGGKL